MNKPSKSFVVTLIIIACVVVLGIGRAYVSWKNSVAERSNISSAALSSTLNTLATDVQMQSNSGTINSSTPVESKTYTNKNFSIKYPSGYIIADHTVNIDGNNQEETITFVPSLNANNDFRILVITKTSGTLETFIKSISGARDADKVTTDTLKVDGNNATRISFVDKQDGIHHTHIIFVNRGIIYDLIGEGTDPAFYSGQTFVEFYSSYRSN
jgi:archaellum component FlaF (FlaF/FlaG flagellin family)